MTRQKAKITRRQIRVEQLKKSIKEFAAVYKRSKSGLLGLAILLFFICTAVFAPFLAPYNPYTRVDRPFRPPSTRYLLGTNDIGQDIFSELIFGTRVSLTIGFAAAIFTVVIGTLVGVVSGFVGGAVDEVLMRFTDVIMILPSIPLLILLMALFGKQSFFIMVLAISIMGWTGTARMVRSSTLSIKERMYVEASKAIGAGDRHIIAKHVLPNVSPLIMATMIYQVAGAMMSEAGLAFLGLGDPGNKSWGMILHYAQTSGGWYANMGYPAWWWIIPPGLCVAFTIASLVLIGQTLEEIINPRLRRR
ncbi:MAG: ABC transporter permease [Candidatus Bathyarchaeota archaeon]|nr:MAG: ABC transporter permease [Candidatus Bathyarchaeota archaeon]